MIKPLKFWRKHSLLLFAAMFLQLLVFAHPDIIITGRVTNEAGEAVSGASVVQKGSNNGTSTNQNGEFSINVNENSVLVFSSVGYESQEVNAGNRSTINVVLRRSTGRMDDVVVIGYGTASKRDLTGSITKVAGREVADKPNTNPVASLQGKVAGLSVVPAGSPGSAPDIRIRGTVSVGSIRPVYVVDGILNDNIDYINPNDIESIEVLKDPSSLAIFGVRGASGVIAVTTKRGRGGAPVITLSSTYGVKKLVDKIKLVGADDFKMLYQEENNNIGAPNVFDFSMWNNNTDWIDAVTQAGRFSNTNLSVSAGNERNRFYMGLGYTVDEGIIIKEKLKKAQIGLGDEYKLSKVFKVGFQVNAMRSYSPNNGNWMLEDARRLSPIVSAGTTPYRMRIYGADSATYNLYSSVPTIQNTLQNPLLARNATWNTFIGQEDRIVGNIFIEANILRNLTARATWYADQSWYQGRSYSPLYGAYDPVAQKGYLVNTQTGVSVEESRWRKYQQDYILTYKTSVNNAHNINATAGFTTYWNGENHVYGSVKQSLTGDAIPNDRRFWYLSNGFEDASSSRSSTGQSQRFTVSGLGRVLYNYQNKYYLNASYRRDVSSVIYNPETRGQNFWAVGAAWELGKEAFMDGVKFFNSIKLKGSIGVLGNQNSYGLDYPFFPRLNNGAAAVFGNNIYNAYIRDYQVDPNLKWETVHGKEIGLEFNSLANRLHAEVNYYDKTTKDVLLYLQNGAQVTLGNFGEISNHGLEMVASYTHPIRDGWNASISGNLTTFKNKVNKFGTKLPAGESNPSQTEAGYPIGYFYGYVVEGIYQSYADKLKSPTVVGYDYGPGDLKYKDINGDGFVTTADRTIIGNPTPDFTYGISLNTNIKNLDLGIDFQGAYGGEIYRVWGSSELPYSRYNYPAFKLERWHGEGTSNWVPRLGDSYAINRLPSTYGIEDASYFRIRNVQIGYNINPGFLSKAHIRGLKIFANAQNIKTWKHNSGYTPELGGGATSFNVDYGSGAVPAIYTGGITLTF